MKSFLKSCLAVYLAFDVSFNIILGEQHDHDDSPPPTDGESSMIRSDFKIPVATDSGPAIWVRSGVIRP